MVITILLLCRLPLTYSEARELFAQVFSRCLQRRRAEMTPKLIWLVMSQSYDFPFIEELLRVCYQSKLFWNVPRYRVSQKRFQHESMKYLLMLEQWIYHYLHKCPLLSSILLKLLWHLTLAPTLNIFWKRVKARLI